MNDNNSLQLVQTQRSLVRLECLKTAIQLCKTDAASGDVFSALNKILPVAARLEEIAGQPLDRAIPPA